MTVKTKYRMGYCRDCGRKTKITRRMMSSRFPSRCSACGGMLDMSDPGKDELDHTREGQSHFQDYTDRHKNF